MGKSKKSKRDVDETPSATTGPVDVSKVAKKKSKKEKKEKKDKKDKRDGDSTPDRSSPRQEGPSQAAKTIDKPAAKPWNDWSSASFQGDEARKSKFLRLLGGKKAENQQLMQGGGQSQVVDQRKYDRAMEKQFEQSRDLSQQQRQGKKAGLGASG
ncbi:hypothetical protein HDU91_003836 [Kappamyces sp. JEL0680]|nr:hypothetical protein HDU91_003836 [Kappamyces sp. JEL0680]